MVIEQYRVVLVDLEPAVGSEARKTRPCVVLSPEEMNMHLDTLIIAPMTRTPKRYPSRFKVKQGGSTGYVMLDQIKTIDRARIRKVLGRLTPQEITKCKATIQELLVD
jgi:mRNA interferase MazF